LADCMNADCIFVIGSNAMEAHPLAGRRLIMAKERGATLIVADPRYTMTAKQADVYVRFFPSAIIPLVNSMMYHIIKEGKEDKEFIKTRTKGFQELKTTVVKYADVEEITGVPTELVEKVALLYAGATNAAIVYCLGVTESSTGTDNVRTLGNLALLTGNVGRPGVGVNPLRGQNNVQGACDMGAYPNVYSGYQAVDAEENRRKMEKAWGVAGLPTTPGLTLTEHIDAAGDEIKSMFILGENPMCRSQISLMSVHRSNGSISLLCRTYSLLRLLNLPMSCCRRHAGRKKMVRLPILNGAFSGYEKQLTRLGRRGQIGKL